MPVQPRCASISAALMPAGPPPTMTTPLLGRRPAAAAAAAAPSGPGAGWLASSALRGAAGPAVEHLLAQRKRLGAAPRVVVGGGWRRDVQACTRHCTGRGRGIGIGTADPAQQEASCGGSPLAM
jgi:hypothetical protein